MKKIMHFGVNLVPALPFDDNNEVDKVLYG
jgi:hypothetical protein